MVPRSMYSPNCLPCWLIALLRLTTRRMGASPIPTVIQRLYSWFNVGAVTQKRTPRYIVWRDCYGKAATIAPLKWLFQVLPSLLDQRDCNVVWSMGFSVP